MEIALDETDSGLDISSAQAAFALLEKAVRWR
jgi:Fe-S cluster assembly ATPase SufC